MTMRQGICPECGSDDIYTRNGWFNNVIVAFVPPRTRIFVCGNCGYLAEFIEAGGPLNYIRSNWEKFTPEEKRKREESGT